MAAGSISNDDFLQFVQQFVQKAEKCMDGWEIRKHLTSPCSYLYKKSVVKIPGSWKVMADVPEEFPFPFELPEDTDTGCLDKETSHVLTYEYNVVYSASYGVPVLYFNVYKQDGKLLSLDEVWATVPKYYQERVNEEKWTFITQQEHPVLQRPYYQLHPCHTAALMSNIQGTSSNYLMSWLSAVGPVVHLDLPLVYGQVEEAEGSQT